MGVECSKSKTRGCARDVCVTIYIPILITIKIHVNNDISRCIIHIIFFFNGLPNFFYRFGWFKVNFWLKTLIIYVFTTTKIEKELG